MLLLPLIALFLVARKVARLLTLEQELIQPVQEFLIVVLGRVLAIPIALSIRESLIAILGGVLAVPIGLYLILAIIQIFILTQVLVVLVELTGTQTPATPFMVALMEPLVATPFITIPMETSTLIQFMAILMVATLPIPHLMD